MTSDHAFEFMIHATVFRLSVIAVGAMLAYLGYRLFVLGVMTDAGGLDAAAGAIKLKLTKAAPGTFFALFGAVLIGTTVIEGAPRLNQSITQSDGGSSTVGLRGGGGAATDIPALFEQLSNPDLRLSDAQPLLHQLALARRNEGRIEEAHALAQLSTNFKDTPFEMWALTLELTYRLGDAEYGDEWKRYLLSKFPTDRQAIEDIATEYRK